MILIGIVGALSPLGQKILSVLKNYPNYKVVWTADRHYECNNHQKSEFKDVESILLSGMQPELIVDVDEYTSVARRAKIYRYYGIPAIMQGALSDEEILFLKRYGYESSIGNKFAPLIIEPDFSTVKTQMITNLLAQIQHFLCDVERVDVEIVHHAENDSIRIPWMHWAEMLNRTLGEYVIYAPWSEKEFTTGVVHFQCCRSEELSQNEEKTKVKLVLKNYKGELGWDLSCTLLETRMEGVIKLLTWYMEQKEQDHDLLLGSVLTDILPKLV